MRRRMLKCKESKLRQIDRLSFSIYPVDIMVINLLTVVISQGLALKGDRGFALAFLLVLVLSVCFSFITYRLVEVQGISLGKNIIKKL